MNRLISVNDLTMKFGGLVAIRDVSFQVTAGEIHGLIGPNGSGESNFLEAFELLRNAPGEITKPIREGGGILEWLWKGGGNN